MEVGQHNHLYRRELKMPHVVAISPLIGSFVGPKGPVRVQWEQIECLLLDGREVAKIKTAPGAAISIYPHVNLSEAEKAAIVNKVTEVRGAPPANIFCTHQLYKVLVEGEDEEETEVDDDELV